jgi:hypothetical protein
MSALRRAVPYHTGKVAIGIAYVPPAHRMGHHAQQLQAALLDQRTAAPFTATQRLLGAIWRWL